MQDQCEAVDFDYLKDIGLDNPVLGARPIDLNDFVGPEWVASWLDDLWCENYRKNSTYKLKRFAKTWDSRGKAVVFVGASPSVTKHIETLKTLDNNFIIVACNTVYARLLQDGVRVDYIFAVEARPHIAKDFTVQDEHTELIVSPFVAPEVLEAWKGKISIYYLGGGKKYAELLELDGIKDIDIGGGNALNTAVCWAYKYLSSADFIFIGTSFCYYDQYYFDNRTTDYLCQFDPKDVKVKAIDIYGSAVNVTPSQLMYKTWLESFVRYAKDAHFINSTEDGILGVMPEIVSIEGENVSYTIKYLPWLHIIPFDLAIKSYRQLFMEANRNGTR